MDTLIKKIKFEGKIVAKSGLHIGGTNSAMAIGGPDSTVIRNPIDNKPYIPGSSLKGKMRALIEITDGTIDFMQKKIPNGPTNVQTNVSGRLFGTANPDDNMQRPSRLIIRDSTLMNDDFKNTDLPYAESKTEIVVDRVTAKTDLRQLERVPAGAEFRLDMVLNIFD
ncbi:MAG TPA: type III-A CRISPR-associated RAMP protein Csm3, partial [Bacteroidales bacterium]|nr:type III-A CRISPR-associated RAMP protein Csm3 [Bacteroidales bacterium]